MDVKTILYGERGIVNGILLELDNNEAIEKFISEIRSPNGKLYFKNNKFKEFTLFNEISLGQFGDPDLIIKAVDDVNINHIIFIEAKTSSYLKNSINLEKIDSARKNDLGSSLTIQLAQKYRFSKTLTEEYSSKNRVEHIFTENNNISYWYDTEYYSKYKNGRYIKKQSILKLIRDEFINSSNKFYFICLVSDSQGIDGKSGHVPLLSPKSYKIDKNFLENNLSIYLKDDSKYNFGYLTYDDLVQANVLSYDSKRAFGQAWDLTVNDSRMFNETPVDRGEKPDQLFDVAERISKHIKGLNLLKEDTKKRSH